MNSAWATVLIAIACAIGGAALNLIVIGFYIGRYKGNLDECRAEVKELRALTGDMRVNIAKIRGRLHMNGEV